MGLVREHGGVILQSSSLYDFCKVEQRGEWIGILVALIEYLRSGESKVGYLNKTRTRNMIHKVCNCRKALTLKDGSIVDVASSASAGTAGINSTGFPP